MKLDKNYMLLFSLSSSLVGLFLIYIATISLEPQKTTIDEITADMEGRKVVVVGRLSEIRNHEDGHIFLTVSDNTSEITVPLFSSFVKELGSVGITENEFKVDSRISVEGIVEIYRGNLQIMPKSLESIKFLGE